MKDCAGDFTADKAREYRGAECTKVHEHRRMRAATQSDGKSTSRKSGDNSEEVTPVPISNTVVKLLSADDTWWEAAWESRTLPVFYYLDLGKIEIKNCAQAQEACDARLFVLQNIFTIQRKDSSHAVFFHFGNVSTFRKYGFLRSSMRHRRKEGNHETCRTAPARYMDVAGFKKQTQLFGSVFLCASIGLALVPVFFL